MVGRNDAHRVRHHHISLVALAEQRFSTLVAQESVPINSDRALLALAVFRLPSGWPRSTRVCCQTSSAHLRSLTSPTAAVYRCWFETVHSSSPRSSSWSSSLRMWCMRVRSPLAHVAHVAHDVALSLVKRRCGGKRRKMSLSF
jgi:hypothetical protein